MRRFGVEGAVARAGCGRGERLSRVVSPNGPVASSGYAIEGGEEPLRGLGGSRRRWCSQRKLVAAASQA
jgi:hypothetical protein